MDIPMLRNNNAIRHLHEALLQTINNQPLRQTQSEYKCSISNADLNKSIIHLPDGIDKYNVTSQVMEDGVFVIDTYTFTYLCEATTTNLGD
ncbi:unnamed protein product [Rotaria magnacalcarata]|nr:unnamed protein product [Rotaria magnacalcarata]